MKKKLLLIITAVILLCIPKVIFGQAPNLGASSSFALFTSVGAFSNLGPTIVTGDIGTNAGPLSGFPPGTLNGQIHREDATSLQAATDLGLAYGQLSTLGGAVLGVTMVDGQTITPGIYFTGAASTINGNVTLDGGGDPNALFIIRIGGALATGTYANILLINGASIDHVFWQVMGQFDLGDYSVFRGNVIAGGPINLLEGSSLIGRALSVAGAIGLHNNSVILGVPPTANAGADQVICANTSIQIGAVATVGSTYSWTSLPVGYTSTDANPTVTPLVTTTYTVVETVTATGLTDSDAVDITVNPNPAAVAGIDRTICSSSSTQIGAIAVLGSTYSWTSVPIGYTSTEADPTVSPGVNTTYTLVETITATGCTNTHSVVVNVNSAATVYAGSDAAVCEGGTYYLGESVVTNAVSMIWSTSGTGSFDTESLLHPVYTPSAADILSGSVMLTLTITPAITCPIISDAMRLTISHPATVNAGPDAVICETSSHYLGESVVTNAVSMIWSTSGTGTFNTASLLHPFYSPSVADILSGSVILTLTITPAATCPVINDEMRLAITRQAIVSAGNDASILEGSSFTVSTATAQNSTSNIWTHNGTGSLTGATTLTPSYIPAMGETGVVTLTLTGASTGPCISAIDQMTLTIGTDSSLRTGIVVTKRATETSYSAVGNVIHYNIEVVNISAINIYNISVTDPNAVIISGNPIAMLQPGKSVTLPATHTITQDDIDAGRVINCAFASGTFFDGAVVTDDSDCITTTGVQRSQITATKFATETTFRQAGEIINYTIEIFNCGNVTLSNITVSDGNAVITSGNPVSSLAPRQTVTATAEHLVTQADLDEGKIDNIAHVAGFDYYGIAVRDDSNEVTLYKNQTGQLVLAKFILESSFSAKGDTIHYVLAAKNYRNTTMSEIVVSDPNAVITSSNQIYSLPSGETHLMYAYHVVTQQDLDAGKVVNVATATGTDYYDVIDYATSNEATIFALQGPGLLLTKKAEETSFGQIGDQIHYTNTVKNSGNVKITGISLSDPNTTVIGSHKIASLNAGESAIIHTIHVVTLADLNLGKVEKSASVSGLDANSQPIKSSSNPVIINAVQNAVLEVTTSAAETTFNKAGEFLHFTILVRNTGNVTVTNLKVINPMTGQIIGNPVATMVPGAISAITVKYVVTDVDLNTGKVLQLAKASAHNPAGAEIIWLSNETSLIKQNPDRLTVVKISRENSYTKAGEEIHYSVTIKNNGQTSLSDISVAVQGANITGMPVIAELPAGSSATLQAIHQVTQTDLDAGLIENQAIISGTDPSGNGYNLKSNRSTVWAMRNPQLDISIMADESPFTTVNQEITYSISVTNTGNLTLTDIELSNQCDLILSNNQIANLAPGSSTEISASYQITVEDLDAGKIVKSVSATGMDPDNKLVSETSNTLSSPGLQKPELSTTSLARETSYNKVGEIIHYNILVKNTGNVSIISTAVTDPNAVIINVRPNTILLPGEYFTVSAIHTISQADIHAGKVISTAKAEGFDQRGNTIAKMGNKVVVFHLQSEIEGQESDIKSGSTSIVLNDQSTTADFNLSNFPNPFSNSTTILFNLPENGKVVLKVYDVTGKEVGQINQMNFSAGENQVIWNSGNIQNGLYFLRMVYKGHQTNRIMSIIQ